MPRRLNPSWLKPAFLIVRLQASTREARLHSANFQLARQFGLSYYALSERRPLVALGPDERMVDLAPRLRCRECDARGKAVVSIRWDQPGA